MPVMLLMPLLCGAQSPSPFQPKIEAFAVLFTTNSARDVETVIVTAAYIHHRWGPIPVEIHTETDAGLAACQGKHAAVMCILVRN